MFIAAIVLTRHSTSTPVRTWLAESYSGSLKLNVESQDDLLGTAQALLNIRTKNRVDSQFIVISGDTIVDPQFLHAMLDTHLRDQATLTLALKYKPSTEADASSSRSIRSGDIIGTDPSRKQLLFMASSDDYVDTPLKIKHSLLDQFNNVKFGYNMLDAHFYIFSRFAMDLLEKQKHTHSIKHEFIPFLLHCQYRPKLAVAKAGSTKNADMEEHGIDNKHLQDAESANAPAISKLVQERSAAHPPPSGVLCRVHFIADDQYCTRVNNMASYIEANRDIASGKHFVKPNEPVIRGAFIAQDVSIGAKTALSNDCNISSGSKIGAKCSIQGSVIGKYCQIADGVKIQGCVLMDNVKVEAGCTLTNTIVCSDATISQGSSLTDCSIGPNYTTEPEAKHTHESLTNISTAL